MDDQPNPLSLPPEAPPRRRADRPDIQVPPSPSSFPDLDEEEHRAPPPGRPPPRRRGLLRYLILLLVVLALILWLVLSARIAAIALVVVFFATWLTLARTSYDRRRETRDSRDDGEPSAA